MEIQTLESKILLALYKQMLYPRMIEEKMLSLLRQGKISKWFSGIGQEAISVGCTMALEADEVIFPMHRNLGVFTSRGIPLMRLLAQWQGKQEGFTKGRDRSFHFGAMDYHIVGMISHLGPQLSLSSGVALAHKLRSESKVSLVFTGEGGASEGEFHEALNVAAVWKLPVLFVIENNGYALSTPTEEQYACTHLYEKGKGYGIEAMQIDGNDVIEVYQTIRHLAEIARKDPKPFLIECKTFRMRGHEEASGTKYVPQELMDYWAKKDPLAQFTSFLEQQNLLQLTEIDTLKAKYKEEINATVARIPELQDIVPDVTSELQDVFAQARELMPAENTSEKEEMRFVDAISDGLDVAMQTYPELVLMGQDIADYGGVFKVTDGLMRRYGKARVRNTPLCESAILGVALGLSIKNIKSMVEMQFSDFVSCGFNQIVNNLAKTHYRWGQQVDVVVRLPSGGGMGAGPFHSQTCEAWFTQVAGLKVVYPSTAYDAKGLLLRAFADKNPVLFFEHKGLYRTQTDAVPTAYYEVEFGKARLARLGQAASIITYGMGVRWAEEAVANLDVDVEILDLRSLNPLDYDAIDATVTKTSRVLILHESALFGGFGGELASYIAEHLFDALDAPVMRCGSLDTPIPFEPNLEKQYMANSQLEIKLTELLNY